MKRLAEYIVRGRWQAVQVVALCGAVTYLLPPVTTLLIYLAAAALALVTLHIGVVAGLQVLLLSMAALLVLFQVIGQHAVVVQLLLLVLVLWVPAWLIAAVLRQSRDLGRALQVATVFGCCALLATYGIFGDPVPWWTERLQQVVSLLGENGVELRGFDNPALLRQVAALMTGMLIASLLAGVMASLLLARWWQSVLVHPGAFREEFCQLRPGKVYGLLTLGVLLFARLSGAGYSEVGAQLALIMLVPYLLTGLAVIHRLAGGARHGMLVLVVVYVLLAVLPQATLLLAAGGLMDTWIDFRRRLARDATNRNKDM